MSRVIVVVVEKQKCVECELGLGLSRKQHGGLVRGPGGKVKSLVASWPLPSFTNPTS